MFLCKKTVGHCPSLLVCYNMAAHVTSAKPKFMFRRRFKRRRVETKSKNVALSTAKKALSEVKKMKRVLKPDAKHLVTTTTAITLPNIAIVVRKITPPSEGLSGNQRIGLSIKLKNYVFRAFTFRSATSGESTFCRIIFFQDLQTNPTLPLATDVLNSENILSTYNRFTTSRFRILRDKTWTLTETTNTSFMFNITLNFNDLLFKFFGASSASFEKNGIFWMAWSNKITDQMPDLNFSESLRYTDV